LKTFACDRCFNFAARAHEAAMHIRHTQGMEAYTQQLLPVIGLYRVVIITQPTFADAWLNLASAYHSIFSGTGSTAESAIVEVCCHLLWHLHFGITTPPPPLSAVNCIPCINSRHQFASSLLRLICVTPTHSHLQVFARASDLQPHDWSAHSNLCVALRRY
jgi:hypothetical protein